MATEAPTHHAPVWLFSFVDLAFLLLIAMTQLDEGRELALQLGEIVVPRIHATAEAMPAAAAARWQLRIHPAAYEGEASQDRPAGAAGTETAGTFLETSKRAGERRFDDSKNVPALAAPFELVLPGPDGSPAEGEGQRIDAQALRLRLAALRAAETPRPLLAPHADSRSQDLLDAVGILEEVWPDRRRATVAPDLAAK